MSLKSEREKAALDLCRVAGNPYHTTGEILQCPYCRFFLEALRAAERRAMERLRALEDAQLKLLERLPGMPAPTISQIREILAAQDLDQFLDEEDPA